MHKKVSLLALLFSVLLFSTFLNVNADCVHRIATSKIGNDNDISWKRFAACPNEHISVALVADNSNASSSEMVILGKSSSGGSSSGPPTLQTMTQADFEDLIRRTFAQDGVKIQDLEDDVSQAVLDALNQGKLKIDFRGLS